MDFVSHKAILESLFFPEFQDRRLKISPAHARTFNWLWTHTTFQDWEKSSLSSLLWLQGKPGSGKSTFSNHLVAYLKDHAAKYHPDHCILIVDFFYSDRGGSKQKGRSWMFQSILWQLLDQAPELWKDFEVQYEERKKIKDPEGIWSLDSLQTIFSELGQKSMSSQPLVVFVIIDAMDESEDQNRHKIVRLLHDASVRPETSLIKFKVFVASRPSPSIGHILRNCQMIKLEHETQSDIQHYIDDEVDRIASEVFNRPPTKLTFVAADLKARSKGVFLWVKLVLLELEEKAMEGFCSLAEIEQLLRDIPSEVDDIYKMIIARIEKKSQKIQDECFTMLSWVALASTPLTVANITEIVAASACGPLFALGDVKRFRVTPEDMAKRIITVCGNLLEVQDDIVQFIHQTAREHLVSKTTAHRFAIEYERDEHILANFYFRYVECFLSCGNFPKHGENWSTSQIYTALDHWRPPSFLPYIYRLEPLGFKTDSSRFLSKREEMRAISDMALVAAAMNGITEFFEFYPNHHSRNFSLPIGDYRLDYDQIATYVGRIKPVYADNRISLSRKQLEKLPLRADSQSLDPSTQIHLDNTLAGPLAVHRRQVLPPNTSREVGQSEGDTTEASLSGVGLSANRVLPRYIQNSDNSTATRLGLGNAWFWGRIRDHVTNMRHRRPTAGPGI
jgi:hypothetical protein